MPDLKLARDICAVIRSGWKLPQVLFIFASVLSKDGVIAFIKREYELSSPRVK